jgi:hypothetical protein
MGHVCCGPNPDLESKPYIIGRDVHSQLLSFANFVGHLCHNISPALEPLPSNLASTDYVVVEVYASKTTEQGIFDRRVYFVPSTTVEGHFVEIYRKEGASALTAGSSGSEFQAIFGREGEFGIDKARGIFPMTFMGVCAVGNLFLWVFE